MLANVFANSFQIVSKLTTPHWVFSEGMPRNLIPTLAFLFLLPRMRPPAPSIQSIPPLLILGYSVQDLPIEKHYRVAS